MPTAGQSLSERRLEVVRRHMASENELDFATTLATFAHPRYELSLIHISEPTRPY